MVADLIDCIKGGCAIWGSGVTICGVCCNSVV